MHRVCFRSMLVVLLALMTTTAAWAAPAVTVNAGSNLGGFNIVARSFSQGSEVGFSAALYQSMANRLRDCSVDLVRCGTHTGITKSGGVFTYNWTTIDAIVDSILAEGGKPFVILQCWSPTPGVRYSDADMETIAGDVVNHFKVRNPGQVKHWEVWNEPDADPANFPTVASYNALYNLVAKKIKAVDPTAKVGGPALSYFGHGTWMSEFLDYVKANSLPFDFISWHFYSYTPVADALPLNSIATDIQTFRNMITARGMAQPEVMITEFNLNASVFGKLDTNFDASYALELIYATSPQNPTKLFFFEPKDGLASTRFWGRWGMLTNDNYPKPVYNAIKLYTTMPTATKCDLSIANPLPGVKAWASRESGRVEVLVWNHNPVPTAMSVRAFNLPFGSQSVQFVRYAVDDRLSNSFYSLQNAELATAESLVLPASTDITRSFTLGAYGVTKLVFRAAATTAPSAPTGVTAVAQAQKNVVRWSPVSSAVSYSISRSTTSGGTYTTLGTGVTGSTWIDPTSNSGAGYFYKVTAVNAAGSTASAAAGPANWSGTDLTMPVTYSDNFAASNQARWTKSGGSWLFSNEEMVQSSTSGVAIAADPCLVTANGSIEVDLKITNASGWAGFSFRRTNLTDSPWASGYLVYVYSNGTIGIWKGGAGAEAVTHLQPLNRFVTVKAVFTGSNIKVYGDGIKYLDVTDTAFTSGYTCLVTNGTSARWDNLSITDATFTDAFTSTAASDSHWAKHQGTWSVVANEFVQSATSGGANASVPGEMIQNGQVRANVRIVSTVSGWAGIAIKKTNPEDVVFGTGYIVYLRANGNVGVYKNGPAGGLLGSEFASGTNPTTGYVNLRVVTTGSTINVYVNNPAGTTPTFTRTDRGYIGGRVSLVTLDASAKFDDVVVSK